MAVVTPAQAEVQKNPKTLDSRLRGNDRNAACIRRPIGG